MRGQVDLTVCIYHGGFERDLTSGRVLSESTENIGYRICALFIGRKRKRIVLQRERPGIVFFRRVIVMIVRNNCSSALVIALTGMRIIGLCGGSIK